ncbi:MAG: transcription elongation factor GreA [Clostridia bacterium]|nr:transcription elongation factor GreA [Clostridia bacterium]MBR2414434.1 transcription elongation factor GreA [Clostridia bacterium]MBR3955770.1 transcription elongation factor GreA [Clostridia bacterium]
MADVYKLTAEEFARYKAELDTLRDTGRKEIARRLDEARSLGDLSENAEYDAAKDDQGRMEARIAELKTIIENSEIIDANSLSTATVAVGLSVKVFDKTFNEEVVYSIVNAPQADPFENKISDASPVGAALLGHCVGDVVHVETPAGMLEFKILDIFK